MASRAGVSLEVSVIIPAFDARATLAEAIESVRGEGERVAEIIVVDDGSTDGTAEVAEGLGARIIRQPNRGPAAARNAGLRLATRDVIGFLDADDLWPEGRLALLLQPLEEEPGLDLVVGRLRRFRTGATGAREFLPEAHAALNLGAALVRARLFDRIGLLDEALRTEEDIDWFLRARETATPTRLLEEVTLFYRRHDRNLSNDTERAGRGLLRVLRRSLERRRDAGETRLEGRGSLGV